jgi:hypothetical protein
MTTAAAPTDGALRVRGQLLNFAQVSDAGGYPQDDHSD